MTKVLNNTFRAFRNRNYSLFFAGQSVSQIGTWMQRTAVIWVIYSLTHSATMIGVAVFAQQFPSFLLSLFGGVIADRHPRYKILLVTQTASMIQAILLAVLILTNHYVIWEILTLSALLGIVNAFDVPARQPMVHEMVADRADLANAISLNSAMVNLARLIGPALSGLVLHKFGAGICFSVNALSFIAVITSLLLMKLPEFKAPPVKKKIVSELVEGLHYLKRTPAISMIVVLLICLSLLVLPYDTIEPVFAKVIFKGDARTYGYITGGIGLGALIGSFLLASAKKGIDLRLILLLSTTVLGAGLIHLFADDPSCSGPACCGYSRTGFYNTHVHQHYHYPDRSRIEYAGPGNEFCCHGVFRHAAGREFADRCYFSKNRRPANHVLPGHQRSDHNRGVF